MAPSPRRSASFHTECQGDGARGHGQQRRGGELQESVIVIKDIFRRHPNRYKSIIITIWDNLETLDKPQAKASMIWIGEFVDALNWWRSARIQSGGASES